MFVLFRELSLNNPSLDDTRVVIPFFRDDHHGVFPPKMKQVMVSASNLCFVNRVVSFDGIKHVPQIQQPMP